MPDGEQLFRDHQEMLVIADRLITSTLSEPFAPEVLAIARRDLAQLINRHVTVEGGLVERLRTSLDPVHRALAQTYFDGLAELRQGYSAHLAQWPMAMVQADRREYRLGVRGLTRKLASRIAWEEAEILPLLGYRKEQVVQARTPIGG